MKAIENSFHNIVSRSSHWSVYNYVNSMVLLCDSMLLFRRGAVVVLHRQLFSQLQRCVCNGCPISAACGAYTDCHVICCFCSWTFVVNFTPVQCYSVWTGTKHIHSFIHFWHGPLGVCSAKRRHQSPEWMILSHVSCFIQGEVVGFHVLLDSLHPCTMSLWRCPGGSNADVKYVHVMGVVIVWDILRSGHDQCS